MVFTLEGKLVYTFNTLCLENTMVVASMSICTFSGNIFVYDSRSPKVQVFDSKYNPILLTSTEAFIPQDATTTDSTSPFMITLGDEYFLLDDGSGKGFKLPNDKKLNDSKGICINHSGQIIVRDSFKIRIFNQKGKMLKSFDSGTFLDFCVDIYDNILTTTNGSIILYDSKGTIFTQIETGIRASRIYSTENKIILTDMEYVYICAN